mmetsp:Transcript_9441/g.20120  ORF Transcript_9441/g.20120 Transcript_9441/m.20120 type:complete len:261 (-) Transcript_9441:373-1155(-)
MLVPRDGTVPSSTPSPRLRTVEGRDRERRPSTALAALADAAADTPVFMRDMARARLRVARASELMVASTWEAAALRGEVGRRSPCSAAEASRSWSSLMLLAILAALLMSATSSCSLPGSAATSTHLSRSLLPSSTSRISLLRFSLEIMAPKLRVAPEGSMYSPVSRFLPLLNSSAMKLLNSSQPMTPSWLKSMRRTISLMVSSRAGMLAALRATMSSSYSNVLLPSSSTASNHSSMSDLTAGCIGAAGGTLPLARYHALQ